MIMLTSAILLLLPGLAFADPWSLGFSKKTPPPPTVIVSAASCIFVCPTYAGGNAGWRTFGFKNWDKLLGGQIPSCKSPSPCMESTQGFKELHDAYFDINFMWTPPNPLTSTPGHAVMHVVCYRASVNFVISTPYNLTAETLTRQVFPGDKGHPQPSQTTYPCYEPEEFKEKMKLPLPNWYEFSG